MSDALNQARQARVEAPPSPWFVARRLPARAEAGSSGQELIPLSHGRIGISMGHVRDTDPERSARLRSAIGSVLRSSADPVLALDAAEGQLAAGWCGVIDSAASTLRHTSVGDTTVLLATPDGPVRRLAPASGGLASESLPPGSTLVVVTGAPSGAWFPDDLVVGCATMLPEQAADQVAAGLPAAPPQDPLEVLLYRQSPADLTLTVPAEPASLAVVRGSLRRWLASAAVGPEASADALLAVGEAASNATEHAPGGVGHNVEMTVRASISRGKLRFEVSDNGRWKPESEVRGHRGHGLPLINALVDSAELTATDEGTTVEMFKELSLKEISQ